MKLFNRPLHFGTSGSLYKNLADPGSMLFGGAGESNSLGQERDGRKGGLFGDKQQGIDWFGSPVTAGTDVQPYARLGALLYGAWAGAGAAGAGGAGSGSAGTAAGSAGTSAVPMGAGAATAGGSTAAAGGGSAGLGAAGAGAAGASAMDSGASTGQTTQGTISRGGSSTTNSGAPTSSQGGPGWMRYAKMAQQGMGMGQKSSYQPNMYMIDDSNNAEVLARLLREYAG